MIVALFWGKVKPEWQTEHYAKIGIRMYQRALEMPGFISLHRFDTDDGRELALAYFETEEQMAAWYNHPEHRAVETLGRRDLLEDYTIEICNITRSYTKATSNFKADEIEIQRAAQLKEDPDAVLI